MVQSGRRWQRPGSERVVPPGKVRLQCEDVWDRLACLADGLVQALHQNLKNIAENAEDPSHKAATLAVGPRRGRPARLWFTG